MALFLHDEPVYRSLIVAHEQHSRSSSAFGWEEEPGNPQFDDSVKYGLLAPQKAADLTIGFAPFEAKPLSLFLSLPLAADTWTSDLPATNEFVASWRVGALVAGASQAAWARVLSAVANFFESSENAGAFTLKAPCLALAETPVPTEVAFEVTGSGQCSHQSAAVALACCKDGTMMLGNTDGDRHTFHAFRAAVLKFLGSRIAVTLHDSHVRSAGLPRRAPALPAMSSEASTHDDAAATQTLEALLDMDTSDTQQALHEWIVQGGDAANKTMCPQFPTWSPDALLRLKQYLLAASNIALLSAIHVHLQLNCARTQASACK
jgi:hypothetical protein